MSTNKDIKVSRREKIANDFLLQFTYAIISSILLLVIYNGRLFKYGSNVGMSMPAIIWTLFALSGILGIAFLLLWKSNQKQLYKIASIYFLVTCLGMFWCIGLEKIMYSISKFIPFMEYFVNAKRLMDILFIIIGLSIPVELAVYFIRMQKISIKKIKMFKKEI